MSGTCDRCQDPFTIIATLPVSLQLAFDNSQGLHIWILENQCPGNPSMHNPNRGGLSTTPTFGLRGQLIEYQITVPLKDNQSSSTKACPSFNTRSTMDSTQRQLSYHDSICSMSHTYNKCPFKLTAIPSIQLILHHFKPILHSHNRSLQSSIPPLITAIQFYHSCRSSHSNNIITMAPYVPPHARTTNPEPSDPSHLRSSSEPTPESPNWSSKLSSRPRSWEFTGFKQKDWRRSPERSPAATPANQNSPPPSSKLDREWRTGGAASPNNWSIGQVVQLPPESLVPATSPARAQVGGNPWNHPAVITDIWEANGTRYVKVQNCTSLGGRGLEARRERDRKYFFEVTPDRLVEGSGTFPKRTYVNCSPTKGTEFTIEYDILSPYFCKLGQRGFIRFNDAAMAELASMRHRLPYDSTFRF